STLPEIPLTVPVNNGDPMENYLLDTTAAPQYCTNYSQITAPPKIYGTWPCPQYWTQQMVFVQVNPGEILTIKADDGTIQNIQGPADVPLISPTGNLPPIYLPPGYISQVVEENGIQKIIVVPQAIDYQMPIPASVHQIPPFPLPISFVYPHTPPLMYPPAQGEVPPTYIQEPFPQQLPPPTAFIYQEHRESYSRGRAKHNQSTERAAKVEECMKKEIKESQVGEPKTSSMANSTTSIVNQANDLPSTSGTPSTNTPSTHSDANALSIYPVNTALSTCTASNAPNTNTVDNPPNTDKTLSDSFTGHDPSPSTSDATFFPDTTDSTAAPLSIDDNPKSTEETLSPSTMDKTPSSSISDTAPNTSNSDDAPCTPIHDAINPPNAVTLSSADPSTDVMGGRNNKQTPDVKQNRSQSSNTALKECKTVNRKTCCFNTEKPTVSDIQTRSAIISWNLQSSENCKHVEFPVTFELAMSNTGKNGNYKNIYIGDEVTFTLHDLQPSMAYFLRVTTIRSSEHRTVSEVVSFTTPGCEPDPPLAPRLIKRSKSSLNLQWKGSNDNGSKINSFLLEWDEGKGKDFKSCYTGTMKQHKIFKLTASTKYSFRLAAKNNFGLSGFSEIAVFYTSGNIPPAPLPPKLKEAGICSLSLEWCAPTNVNPNDSLTYVLEMEETKSGLGFKPKYNGEDLSCTIKNLQRNTTYKFRIFSYNLEGRSNSSGEVKYTTCPDKPGCPRKPYVMGKIHANKVKIGWQSPNDNGGTCISSYSLEVSENSDVTIWNVIYNGTLQEFLYDQLQPGTTYKLRVFCTSPVGQSQPSDVLTIQTPTLPPASCQSSPLSGKTKSKEAQLQLDNPPVNGNLETPARVKKTRGHQRGRKNHPNSEKTCMLGTLSTKCGIVPVRRPPSQCGTPVLTCKGPTCIVVSWEIPECNGAEITEYRLQWGQVEDSMHLIYTGPCLHYEVKGLIPATTYFCKVQAANIVGVGMFGGAGRATTPGSVPAMVPMLHVTENKVPANLVSSCIAIQWEEPDCHGSPITGYNIEYGHRKVLSVGRVTKCVLKNLQPNTIYKIRVQAINHYGLSPFTQPIRAKTKPLPPEPPHLDCVVNKHHSLKLKWGNSSNKRALSSPISYNLLMGDQSGRFSVIYHGTCQTHKVQKLREYTEYKFKIQACNETGEGPLSDIYIFTTIKTPPPTLKAPKLHQINNNTCVIKWTSLQPIKGDSIVYNLQITSEKGTEQIYKGPNTTFSFTNYLANSRYHFKVCAGRQYQNSDGIQEVWGPYSPSTTFSTCKPGHGKGGRGKGKGNHTDQKTKSEMSSDKFIVILMMGFALAAILCVVAIQYFLIK
uniref:Fibronectin type III domain containing protein 3C1-like n=1 Tax=Jaculus jaculus TaxID=51337 RepID=A0A8C5KRL0_JACJA